MAKFSGPSVIPGATPILPTEGKVSDFADILSMPVSTQPTEEVSTEPVQAPQEAAPIITTPPAAEVAGDPQMEPMAMPEALPTAPTIEGEQRALERIPAITERLNVTSLTPSSFKSDQPISIALQRSANTSNILNTQLAASLTMAESETIGQFPEATLSRTDKISGEIIPPAIPLTRDSNVNLSAKGIFFDPRVLDAGKYNQETGRIGIDPEFGSIMSLVTESYLHNQMVANEESGQAPETLLDDPTESQTPGRVTTRIAKAKGRERLGREIYQEWKRQSAVNQGRPSDDYLKDIDAVAPETFTFIGDMAKEVYAKANPDILVRDDSQVGEPGGQVYFQLTSEGALELERLNNSFKGLFALPDIPPLNAPSATAQPVFESRMRVRPVTTKIGDMKNTTALTTSIANYNKVTFINDPTRETATMMVGMLGLLNAKVLENQFYSDMLGVGDKKLAELINEKERLKNAAMREQDRELIALAMAYDPIKILQSEREKAVNILAGIAKYSGKENYLTYSIQALTGRTHVQQTVYNPQSHKIVRGVVGSGNIFKWKAGSGGSLENSWKEIIATRLFTKAGAGKTKTLSTPERLRLFEESQRNNSNEYVQAVAWGNELIQATENFDTAGAKELFIRLRNSNTPDEATAIKQEMKQRFSNDPLSGPLKAALASHDKEFGMFVGYYIELAKYDAALKSNTEAGKQFVSTLTVEQDGMTHGPATNAILLGIPEMAKRGGFIRTQDLTAADEIDLRDAMKEVMLDTVSDQAGALYPQEKQPEYKEMLELAVRDKDNFLKKSPMTMGYGQELASLKMHVETTVFTGPQGEAIRAAAERAGITPDKAIEFLHAMLVDSIFNVLDSKVVNTGRLLKANALFSTITNELLYFDNAMGFRSYAAGKQMVPELTRQTSFSWRPKEGETKGKKVSIELYKEQPEASAVRPGMGPGGYTSGRIQPIAVQSYDGNMVARTGGNSSWDTISNNVPQGGKPFVLPIFDAFVTDLGSFESVRQESNRHWSQSIQQHSYVKSIFEDWYAETTQAVQKKLSDNPQATIDWAAAKDGKGPFKGLAFQFERADPDNDILNLQLSFARTIKYRAKEPGETVNDYKAALNRSAKSLTNQVIKEAADERIDLTQDTITNAQAFRLIKIITNKLELSNRNNAAVKTITQDKNEMMKMVRLEPRNVDL